MILLTLERVYGGQKSKGMIFILIPTQVSEAVENQQIICRMKIKMGPSIKEVKNPY